MACILLGAAGMVEIVMAIALKHADGWTRLGPSVLGIGAALASIFLLTSALKTLPVGTAYAIWTGIGAIGVSLIGIFFLDESAAPGRLACLVLVFGGIIGLHLLES